MIMSENVCSTTKGNQKPLWAAAVRWTINSPECISHGLKYYLNFQASTLT